MVAQPVPLYFSGKNRNRYVKNNELSHPSGVDLEAKAVYWGVSGQFLLDSLVTNATSGGDYFEIRPTAGITAARCAQQDSPSLAPGSKRLNQQCRDTDANLSPKVTFYSVIVTMAAFFLGRYRSGMLATA